LPPSHPGGPSNDSDSQYSWSLEALPYVNTFPEPDGQSIYSGNAVQPYSSLNTSDEQMGEGQLAAHMVSLLTLIRDKRASGSDTRPFFFAAGFHRPHIPWHAPSKYFDMYNLSLPLAPHQHTPSDVPPIALNSIWTGSGSKGYGPGKGYWTSFPDLKAVNISGAFPSDNSTVPEDEQRRIRQAYRAALSFTDRNIGVVLDAAGALGLLARAIVVLWADHGYQLGDNDQYGKHTNFEHATRIPFMVRLPADRYPHFKPRRSSAFVENVDLMPTLAELALPDKPLPRCPADANASRATLACTDGLSFAPLLTQEGGGGGGDIARWKNASFSQYNRQGELPPNGVMGYSIRVDGWRYTEWVKFDRAHAGFPGGAKWDDLVGAELYQHAMGAPKGCDWSYEHTNLANKPAYADTRAALSTRLRAGWRHALPSQDADARLLSHPI
jgi:arylsulfatase A-like enzyme